MKENAFLETRLLKFGSLCFLKVHGHGDLFAECASQQNVGGDAWGAAFSTGLLVCKISTFTNFCVPQALLNSALGFRKSIANGFVCFSGKREQGVFPTLA